MPEDAIDVDQWIRSDSSRSTTAYHLEKIVWVHKRIVIKVNGSQNDALFQNLTIDVASQQLLAESEDNFLKWLILNATSGPMWVRSSSLISWSKFLSGRRLFISSPIFIILVNAGCYGELNGHDNDSACGERTVCGDGSFRAYTSERLGQ